VKYARVIKNVVNEVFTPPEGVDISECFHPDVVKQFTVVSEEVEREWVFDGEKFIAPVV